MASGGLPYKSKGDTRWNIKMKPLRETNVGVAYTELKRRPQRCYVKDVNIECVYL